MRALWEKRFLQPTLFLAASSFMDWIQSSQRSWIWSSPVIRDMNILEALVHLIRLWKHNTGTSHPQHRNFTPTTQELHTHNTGTSHPQHRNFTPTTQELHTAKYNMHTPDSTPRMEKVCSDEMMIHKSHLFHTLNQGFLQLMLLNLGHAQFTAYVHHIMWDFHGESRVLDNLVHVQLTCNIHRTYIQQAHWQREDNNPLRLSSSVGLKLPYPHSQPPP